MAFDILLKNGRIIDGKGNPWFRGDVAVADGRIHAVRSRIQGEAREELDASQYVVCPGFIDAHTHSDYVFFVDPTAQSKVRQGVTTEVTGNCGMSGAPYSGGAKQKLLPAPGGFVPFWESIPEYLETLARQPKTVNIAPLIGHGTLRAAIVGHGDRPPTPDELARMKACLAAGLEAGAVGLSTRLYFAPGAFASEQELVELASIAGRHGTVVTSHIRDEGSRSVGFIPAVREILRIGRDARVPVHISHIMIGSDGSSLSTEGPLSRGNPHPRNISQPQTKEAAGWRPLADQVRALGPFAALSGSGESARPRP